MPPAAAVRVEIVLYGVQCRACLWAGLVPSGFLAQVADAHRAPLLVALHVRMNGGPLELWRCQNPRPLMG